MIKILLQPLLHLAFLIIRPLTIGVRGLCLDSKNNSILLVKHTYSDDWALPGGGVEVGESTEAALKRELKEEVGFICEEVSILNLYHNKSISKRDHVVIYIVNSWSEQKKHAQPKMEISNTKWFSLNNLPDNLTPCTYHTLEKFGLQTKDDFRGLCDNSDKTNTNK
jgi:ADP-ribose pyrophosphatase YjhB (NUDIX family)